MKKLALIILMAVYALAIVGAGIAPVMAAGHTVCTHANDLAFAGNEPGTGGCSSETCNTGYAGFSVKEHQHTARQFHFSSRHIIKAIDADQPAIAPFSDPKKLFSNDIHTQAAPVPAYILHCVYRL